MIPNSKVNQLIQYKDMLTTKQKQYILNALQTGSNVHIKPTRVQQGGFLGTLLASIGIPMLLDAITGKGLQVDANRSRRSLPVYVPSKVKKRWRISITNGLQKRTVFRIMGSNEE